MKVFIGCSANEGLNQIYYDEAKKLCNYLVSKNCSLVFGGCIRGIMGVVYKTFKDNNKEVYAIQTRHYSNELSSLDCNKEIKASTLEQLECFMNNSDLLLFLPGGYGTYNEIFYMLSEYINETHKKNVIIYNINNYFDGIKIILDNMKNGRFATSFDFVKIVNNLDEFKSLMEEIC